MDIDILRHLAPQAVAWQREPLAGPGKGQVLVRTQCSALSPGTEGLLFRGSFPPAMPLDSHLPAMSGAARYPFSYGYSAVGRIEAVGSTVDPTLVGRRVFGFQPHATAFVARPEELLFIPDRLSDAEAVLYPLMETAVTLVMDARVRPGDRVVVWGQGILGLMATFLLSQMPLEILVTVEPDESRRRRSLSGGADRSQPPGEPVPDFDVALEVSGRPEALAEAWGQAGYGSRIVVGSWYPEGALVLAPSLAFHRNRVEVVSSQVSTLDPAVSGRWNRGRRSAWTWTRLEQLHAVSRDPWTRSWPRLQAQAAFQSLNYPSQALVPVLDYSALNQPDAQIAQS